MDSAPVALFVYNRLQHTKRTLDALKENRYSDVTDLTVFSDGPKSETDSDAVKSVRHYIRQLTDFRSVKLVERKSNLGLANSIISGVSAMCKQYGSVIVLEDDLVTSPYFLSYMNDTLRLYRDNDKVISVHGYVYPVHGVLPETFFLRGADCWGWATWKRGWDLFEPDGRKLLAQLEGKALEDDFNFGGSYDYMGMLRAQIAGKNNSWAIRWYASAFLQEKLTLYPGRSLIHNIGNDGSGTHCGRTDVFSVTVADMPVEVGNISVAENPSARASVTEYFRSIQLTWSDRVKNKIMHLLNWHRC